MARLFQRIFKNIFFAGWRVLFQHKEPDDVLEGVIARPGKTLKELQGEEKKPVLALKQNRLCQVLSRNHQFLYRI